MSDNFYFLAGGNRAYGKTLLSLVEEPRLEAGDEAEAILARAKEAALIDQHTLLQELRDEVTALKVRTQRRTRGER